MKLDRRARAGRTGSGRTSDVIAGIDWVIAQKLTYNIKVINLSLGHPVTEPSATDPLCLAVARAVASGITVAVSSGNYGLTSAGAPVLGGITSPGNAPLGVDGRRDRHARNDRSLGRHRRAVQLARPGPLRDRREAGRRRAGHAGRIARGAELLHRRQLSAVPHRRHGKNAYLRLSGTSMSTAVVSGGIALLLNAEPYLTPAQVKIALQMGARFMPNEGLIGGGAGSVNFAQSLKVAQKRPRQQPADDGHVAARSVVGRGVPRQRHADRPGLRSHRHPAAAAARSRRALRQRGEHGAGRAEPGRDVEPAGQYRGELSGLG